MKAIEGEVIPAEPLQAWERQSNESSEAWEAWVIYRDMPVGTRSLASVGRTLGKSTVLMERWSSTHNWIMRIREYDRYLDRRKMRELEAEYAEMGRRQGQQAAYLAELLMHPAKALIKRIQDDPDKFAQEVNSMELTDAMDMAIKAARVWPQVMKAERLAHGLSTENISEDIDGAVEHVIRIDEESDPVTYLRSLAELASDSGDSSTDK